MIALGVLVLAVLQAAPGEAPFSATDYLSVTVAIDGLNTPATLRIRARGAADTVLSLAADTTTVAAPILMLRPTIGPITASIDGAGTARVVAQSIPSTMPASAGPAGVIVSDAAYEPTYGWEPGWLPSLRRGVVLIAISFSGGVLLLTLSKWRRASVTIVLISLIASAAIVTWSARHPAVFQASGDILVELDDGTLQRDRWSYQASMDGRQGAFRWTDNAITWPAFASAEHMERCEIELHCDQSGKPVGFVFRLQPRGRIAFVTRSFEHMPLPGTPRNPVTSRLGNMAHRLYEDARTRVLGEFQSASDSAWPIVVMQRTP